MPNKIEQGCLAIVVDGLEPNRSVTNIGKITRVGKFIGTIKDFIQNDWWEVDVAMRFTDGSFLNFQREEYLSRIPEEPDTNFIISQEEILTEA